MAFRLLGSVCDPPSPANADGFGASAERVVLLDGAAPRAARPVSSHPNDTVWLVRRFLSRFFEPSASGGHVPLHVEQMRQELEHEYAVLCERAGFVPEQTPFACLAVAEDTGDDVLLYNMGDLTTLLCDAEGRVSRFGESSVRELDRHAIALMARALEAGVKTHEERRRSIDAVVAHNQAQRNLLAGYDVLDLATSTLGHFEQRRVPRAAAQRLLLMSDGFYRLVDTFERYDDQGLYKAVERRGLEALLDELRELERADPEREAVPRFKRHDDATAVWLAVS